MHLRMALILHENDNKLASVAFMAGVHTDAESAAPPPNSVGPGGTLEI